MSEKAKTDGFEPKHLHKKAAQEAIPGEILWRKNKNGFPTPIGIWLEQQAKEVEEILLSENLYHLYFFLSPPMHISTCVSSRFNSRSTGMHRLSTPKELEFRSCSRTEGNRRLGTRRKLRYFG